MLAVDLGGHLDRCVYIVTHKDPTTRPPSDDLAGVGSHAYLKRFKAGGRYVTELCSFRSVIGCFTDKVREEEEE